MKQKAARGYLARTSEEPARLKFKEGGAEEPQEENKESSNENMNYRKPRWLRGAANQEELGNRDPIKENKEEG